MGWKTSFLSGFCLTPAVGFGVFRCQSDAAIYVVGATAAPQVTLAAQEAPPAFYASGIVEGACPAADLRFEIAGRVAAVDIAEGKRVRQGDVLARLDATDWKNELQRAEAELLRAKAECGRVTEGASSQARAEARWQVDALAQETKLARRTYLRLRELDARDSVTAETLDKARGAYAALWNRWKAAKERRAELEAPPRDHELNRVNAELALANSAVERARAQLAKTELRAPSDGIVLRVGAEPGELSGPGVVDPVVTMVNDSQLRVRCYVEELDALHVHCGLKAQITADGLPGVELTGNIRDCYPQMARKSLVRHDPTERLDVKVREVMIAVDALPADAKLVIGLPVDVKICADATETPPAVPLAMPSHSLAKSSR